MIYHAQTIEDRTHVVAKVALQHPMVDEMSISLGTVSYADFPSTVELAFFKNGKWVCEPILEFSEYADTQAGDTRVYGWVPLLILAEFLDKWMEK